MNKTLYKKLLNGFIFVSVLIAVNNDVAEKINAEIGIAAINKIENINIENSYVKIDIYSINQVPIAGVQFEIHPDNLFEIDSVSGGICSEVDFSLHSNKKGLLLGFSLQGKVIPKSTSSKIKDNILFSVYGNQIKDISDEVITLKATLAGKKGNKINAKVNEYVYSQSKSMINKYTK